MSQVIQKEIEVKFNKVWLHIYTQEEYKEDYQIPMLKRNRIPGILQIEGCEVEGKGCYTYDISGFISMKTLYEKERIQKKDIEQIVESLLKTAEMLRLYMLNPGSLLLDPEYIFQKAEEWYFCYLPEYEKGMGMAFHELTEYFVKMLDYEDTEGIFLAYELHKATLQEHYNLSGIMEEYRKHEQERRKAEPIPEETYGNIFSLEEEPEEDAYETSPAAETIREESGWSPIWKRALRHLPGKSWGQWNDLIMETDRQEEKSIL